MSLNVSFLLMICEQLIEIAAVIRVQLISIPYNILNNAGNVSGSGAGPESGSGSGSKSGSGSGSGSQVGSAIESGSGDIPEDLASIYCEYHAYAHKVSFHHICTLLSY